MSKYSVRPATRLKRSPQKSNTDDLRFLSWRTIEEMGGPSKWTLQRAAARGEIKLSKLGRSGGARESEHRRYVEAQTFKVGEGEHHAEHVEDTNDRP